MLRKLLLASTSILLTLLAVEAAIRIADLRIASLHRSLLKLAEMEVLDPERNLLTGPPGGEALLFGHETRFNSYGMRDREPDVPKPPGRFRVMLLGDSMVFAPAVPQTETATEILRTKLAGAGLDVVSAGIPGWNSLDEEQFLSKHVDELDPDLVVLLYVENDNEPLNPFHLARRPPGGMLETLYRAALLHSRAFEWVTYVWRSRIAGPDAVVVEESARWDAMVAAQGPAFSPADSGWLASRDALTRMSRSLAERGARLVVFLFDLGTIDPAAPVRQRLRELSLESGVPFYETRPFFEGHDPASLMIEPLVDPHPNAEGHRLLGEGLARTLLEAGLVAR